MIRHVDVHDLVGRPGTYREVRLAEPIEGLAMPLAEIPADAPVDVELLLESVVEGILVSGRVAGPLKLRCARCLTEFGGDLGVEVRELFAAQPDAEAEEYPLEGDHVNLEPLVRDAVVPELPFSPLCKPDCLGLCERCGGDRNRAECSCPPVTDPRWAGLEALLTSDLLAENPAERNDPDDDEPGPNGP
jgi:uncharacterized protein